MILEVPQIVRDLLPDRLAPEPLSAIRIETTKPLFLVFGPEADRPLCVVQFGSRHDLEQLHSVLTTLSAALPDLVPSSLLCRHWRNDLWVQFQSGVAGVPWFRFSAEYSNLETWLALRVRALNALGRLHASVRAHAPWRRVVSPRAELLEQSRLARAASVALSTDAWVRIDAASERLGHLGEVAWYCQHGDFCLNNILVSGSGLGVVDFEEFGETAVPLHDEFGLALSLDAFTERIGRPGLADHIRHCLAPTVGATPSLSACADGLLFHHLLWRVNKCATRPARRDIRARLIEQIEHFSRAPTDFLCDSAGV